jgi:hypothetical protein
MSDRMANCIWQVLYNHIYLSMPDRILIYVHSTRMRHEVEIYDQLHDDFI